MKRKWWLFLGVSITAVAISLCFFGVRVRIAPRLVLSGALNKTIAQLETRFVHSPLRMFGDILNPAGCYQADLQMETESEYMGLTRYDMDLKTQLSPLRVSGTGTVVAGGKALDLSVFLDGDFAAVSSDSLLEGNYYGITYDTFSEDIRSRELLAVLIGENTISQWESSVSSLAETMSLDLKLPEFTPEDIRTALYAVLALKPQVSKQQTDVSGEKMMTYAVSFEATGQQILEAAQPHQEELTRQLSDWIDKIGQDPDFLVTAVYFLSRGELVKLEVGLQYAEGSSVIEVFLGNLEEEDPIEVNLESIDGNYLNRFRICIESTSDEDSYREEIQLAQTQNGIRKSWTVDYDYDLSSHEMELQLVKDGKKAEMRMHLAGEGERITITTQNAAPLLNLFREKPMKSPAICTLSISPGGSVAIPEYRNLDQWSMEDLWTLLKGLGGLIGLKLP